MVTLVPVLAHARGKTPSQTFLVPANLSNTQFSVDVSPAAALAPGLPVPTGTTTLYDGTTAIGSPTTLHKEEQAGPSTFAQTYGTPDPVVAAAAKGGVWGDFNADGAPDLLVYGPGSGDQPGLVVQTFLQVLPPQLAALPPYLVVAAQQLALPLKPQDGQSLAVLDVDGDGHLDLLAGNTVAYGNGDGTFGRVAVLPFLATGFSQTYAVDIDGDGKLDIVAVNTPPSVSESGTVQFAFTVFHNNGGGSFTAQGPYPLAPSFAANSSATYNIFGLSFADVNGDGRMDVLSQSNVVPAGYAAEPAALNVMLNQGTGFGPPQAIDTSSIRDEGMVSTAFADLNNDTRQDLVFSYQSNTGNNGVATLLGHGDGTFAAPVNFAIGSASAKGSPLLPLLPETQGVNTEIVLGSGVLLLSNGDGTLTAGPPLFSSTAGPGSAPPVYALPVPPLIVGSVQNVTFLNLNPGQNAFFAAGTESFASLTPVLTPGTHSLTAHYSGDANYAPSVSNTVTITTAPAATPTMAITSSATSIYATNTVTFTATLSDPTLTGTVTFLDAYPGSNPLQPVLDPNPTTLGTATAVNGVATFMVKQLPAGIHTITAVYGANIYTPIAQAQMTETVKLPFNVEGSSLMSLTASPGGSATTTFTVQPLGGFSGTITLGGCTAFACTFSPATVTFSGTQAATITLTTTAISATSTAAAAWTPARVTLACGLPLFALLGFACGGRRRALFLAIALACCVAPFTGCSGGQSDSTPSNALKAGTYPFYVFASSGQNEQAVNAELTVQ